MDEAAMAAVALDDGGTIALLALGALVVGALLTLVAGIVVASDKVNKLGSSIDDWVGPIQGSARRPNGPIERKSLSG